MNGEKETSYSSHQKYEKRSVALEDAINLLTLRDDEISRLKLELNHVKTERDLLLCEVSKLKFELEIAALPKIYNERSSDKFIRTVFNGSAGNSRDCNGDDEEDICGDIDDIGEEEIDNANKLDNSEHYQHRWHSGRNSIRNNSSEFVNYYRAPMNYELSQDLIDKQIELLERKYGGPHARQAAVTIQRAFRRYTLLKKFAHITAMAKADKRLGRRARVEPPERPCESSSAAANATPLRSLSMREKRLAESDGTGSLPRYGRCGGYCEETYAQPSSSVGYYVKETHLGTPDHKPWDGSYCASTASQVTYTQYQTPCQKRYTSPSYRENASYQMMMLSSSQMSTPTKRVPPEVPKRTSSISFKSDESQRSSSEMTFGQTKYSGSMSSVQSSSSDSSNNMNVSHSSSLGIPNYPSAGNNTWNKRPQVSEVIRKRQYRVGLNLFNKKPEKGISYLMRKGFLDNTPQAVAKFLIARKGLSKQMIGEYLGNVQNQFNIAVLEHFVDELDLSGMQIDVALRKYQTYFRMPGEAQKIERLMQIFSQRYCRCNRDVVSRFKSLDTVFVLAFATIMLNTDLHTPNLKSDKRMKLEDFIKNLRGVDECGDVDRDMLVGIYERIKANEFKPGNDHVSQVIKVQSTIVGKKLVLAQPHRRLVCYCRLYEVLDINKKDRPGVHQREVFLFNDLLVITKIFSKKKDSVTYSYRTSFPLTGLSISMFQTHYYQFGIQLTQRLDNQVLITFNARNDHDRTKFVEDIRESILEMDEMENIRIEAELERQKPNRTHRCNTGSSTENRDSGVADVEVCQCLHNCSLNHGAQDFAAKSPIDDSSSSVGSKKNGLSNSLLNIHDQN